MGALECLVCFQLLIDVALHVLDVLGVILDLQIDSMIQTIRTTPRGRKYAINDDWSVYDLRTGCMAHHVHGPAKFAQDPLATFDAEFRSSWYRRLRMYSVGF
jgi:hypothetical protein